VGEVFRAAARTLRLPVAPWQTVGRVLRTVRLFSICFDGFPLPPAKATCVSCLAVGLATVLAALLAGDELSVNLVGQEALRKGLEAGLVPLKERQATIRGMFEKAGCVVTEQAISKRTANVICTLPGQTNATILIGGHFDYVEAGRGIIDDWSGTALLPALYQALKDRARKHTYRFVAFAAEEEGLVGSAHYVKNMSAEEKQNTQAFVNLECLGLAPPEVWASRAQPFLLDRLDEVARLTHTPLRGVNVERVGKDDSFSFAPKKIPVITIHSLTQETLGILHTGRDRLEQVQMDDYATTYRLVVFYLAYLDVKLT
jgi:hypothetical protein